MIGRVHKEPACRIRWHRRKGERKMEVSLNHLRPGMDAVVVSVWGCDALCRHLRAVGVVPGANLHCLGKDQNGQVTLLQVKEGCIRLRTRDLEKILVCV